MSALSQSPLLDVSHEALGAAGPITVDPAALAAGQRIGRVVLTRVSPDQLEFRTPGDLGAGRLLVGLVPILWALAAWARCLREGTLDQQASSCAVLTALAVGSALVLLTSTGCRWRFDARRRRVTRRAGPLLLPGFWRRIRATAARVEPTPATRFAPAGLRLVLARGQRADSIEVARWPRTEIDREQVEALAHAIRERISLD